MTNPLAPPSALDSLNNQYGTDAPSFNLHNLPAIPPSQYQDNHGVLLFGDQPAFALITDLIRAIAAQVGTSDTIAQAMQRLQHHLDDLNAHSHLAKRTELLSATHDLHNDLIRMQTELQHLMHEMGIRITTESRDRHAQINNHVTDGAAHPHLARKTEVDQAINEVGSATAAAITEEIRLRTAALEQHNLEPDAHEHLARKAELAQNVEQITGGSALTIKTLSDQIQAINRLLQSDDVDLNEMQELVNKIKTLAGKVDSLAIEAVAGLRTELDRLAADISTEAQARQQADAAHAADTAAHPLLARKTDVSAQLNAALDSHANDDAAHAHLARQNAVNDQIQQLQNLLNTEIANREENDELLETRLRGEVTGGHGGSSGTETLKALRDDISALQQILSTNHNDLDSLQEIVDRIGQITNSVDGLTIGSIAGLQAALDALSAKDSALETALADEVAAREATDLRIDIAETMIAESRRSIEWFPSISEDIDRSNSTMDADPADATYSPWVPIHGNKIYATESGSAVVHCEKSRSARPGYYETPQYATMWSSLRPEFVISNEAGNSLLINARLAELGVDLVSVGGWDDLARSWPIPIISVPDSGLYMTLWLRWNNGLTRFAPVGAERQSIVDFGGNASLVKVRRVEVYGD